MPHWVLFRVPTKLFHARVMLNSFLASKPCVAKRVAEPRNEPSTDQTGDAFEEKPRTNNQRHGNHDPSILPLEPSLCRLKWLSALVRRCCVNEDRIVVGRLCSNSGLTT
jgi:hypothetical protein